MRYKVNIVCETVHDGQLLTPKDANGKTVEPFIIDGTTYLPVRAVGNALGLDVNWDGKTKTVVLSTPGIAKSGTYGRSNPAPVGITQKINIDDFLNTYTADVTVTEILRGAAAYEMIKDANMFNDEPEAGKQYILAKIKITVTNIQDDKTVSLSEYMFTPFSSDNTEYTRASVVEPSPVFEGSVYSGATFEGYVTFLVNTNDTTPKIVFGRNYDGTGGIWFALY